MNDELLIPYIGKRITFELRSQIEKKFNPYKVKLCSAKMFYYKEEIYGIIRCLVDKNYIIVNLSFN